VSTDKKVLRQWLKAGYMENRTLFPTEAGTPQGGVMTPQTHLVSSSFPSV